mmetsp:Transcript_17216/g.58874  ORF Transcript_17216/g.58874 Transcript_17216/m.58874 type:complete len:189 (+) Transcript_17216:18-584(+)
MGCNTVQYGNRNLQLRAPHALGLLDVPLVHSTGCVCAHNARRHRSAGRRAMDVCKLSSDNDKEYLEVWQCVREARRLGHERWKRRVRDSMWRGGEGVPPGTRMDEAEGPVRAVSAGLSHALGLRRDGSVEYMRGNNTSWEPPPEYSQGPFVAVSAGLGLRPDGSIQRWGSRGRELPVHGPFSRGQRRL